jgi:hypothetical protein
MKEWKELDLQGLHWEQQGAMGRHFALKTDEGNVIATLVRPNWLNNDAEVNMPGNRWRFERRGFFRQHINITAVATGAQPARFEYHTFGGELIFRDGRRYHWKQSGFFGTKWAWVTPDGEPFLGFQSGGLLRLNGEVSASSRAEETESLMLLMFLGWHLLTLYHDDAATVAAAAN